MTPEERSLLERTASLTLENNKILRAMQRSRRWAVGLRIAYWVIVILFALGAFYFIKPYINGISSYFSSGEAAEAATSTQSSFGDKVDTLKELLN